MASRGRGAAARGANFERAVMHYMDDMWGLGVERIRSGRSTDAGDLTWRGSEWLIDCKSRDRISLLTWMKEAWVEADVEGVKPALVVDWPGLHTSHSVVCTLLEDSADLWVP